MERRGSQVILDALKEEGIKTIFGYPGGCMIPLFDELLNYPELELIRVRHEQGAAHAADGMARASGKAAVVFVTSGPGATNTVTGIATAAMDSVPMVIVTGQVRQPLIGTDAFQETNVIGVTRPVTKHNYLVKDIRNLPRIMREAFYIAQTGRPGPVLIDVPVDMQGEMTDAVFEGEIDIRGYHPKPEANQNEIRQAWEMIRHASRPVIYAGGGINLAHAGNELTEFANKTGIPITTTLLGKGGIPEDNPLYLGMLGMHGTYAANMAMTRADLVIALGARFDDRVTGKVDEFLKQAKIIHIDIDPSVINKIIEVDLGMVACVKNSLFELNKLAVSLDTTEWVAELDGLKEDKPLQTYTDKDMKENEIRPEYVISELSKATNGEAVVVSDVGQHQMFVALHYQFKHQRSHLSSGGLGTMGYGLPAAMGAAFHVKDRPVISVSGDGGFQMNMQELATIRSYNLPVKILIMNNSNLGMVKQWQDLFWRNRHSHTIFEMNPDFTKLADSFSIPGFRTGKKEELPGMIKEWLDVKGPALLEVKIDEHAHVYPMIPAGASLFDIMTGGK